MNDTTSLKTEKDSRNLRYLLILEELANAGVPATPSEINKHIGLPKQTIHRLFSSMEESGFIQRDHDGRSYSPGKRARQMATGLISSQRVRMARLAVMNKLAEHIGETCNLSIPDRDGMIYLDRVETLWPLRIDFPIGTKVPLHCTASGKLYLSTLTPSRLKQVVESTNFEKLTNKTITESAPLLDEIKSIRKKGFSQDDEEFTAAMVALAVPVMDNNNRMFASLSFHAPTPRMTMDDALSHLGALKDAALALSEIVN